MGNKMLIDATHPEETRVVVVRGNRVEDFDFEAANRKQLRGNIYLAKVTRVEPSLQAAFVEYGGNRHGFLAFSEIHPDYYQIPAADRARLLEEEERAAREEEQRSERRRRQSRPARTARPPNVQEEAGAETGDDEFGVSNVSEVPHDDDNDVVETVNGDDGGDDGADTGADEEHLDAGSPGDDWQADEATVPDEAVNEAVGTDGDDSREISRAEDESHEDERTGYESDDEDDRPAEAVGEEFDSVGAEDALEEVPERRFYRMRQYKIQEVIKRRQVLLIQVVKEERGNKGAALTTYLSLAGRYSVLMPNSGRGGGISRKITNVQDRKRLRQVAEELEVPDGMGVILRTAGAARTKQEIKRDFEYLMRLWDNVRDLTLKSTAPALVYEEGSLVKRSIRDLYNKDIDEILVAGPQAYREARDFMRMLMPSHARNVQPYQDLVPIFARFGVEPQLDAMFSPQVTLKSGGYLVINQTEALVAIDVNSGRSTREHNIEDTALTTNLEASDEVARQLRLRDLAGLIVIDFIDMEEMRNNRAVERRLKDALRNDRARIQVGRISHFGLMEMSRQRIRTGVLEGSTELCPHCLGAGVIRSTESVALHVLRALEDYLLRSSNHHVIVHTRTQAALYILNHKRHHLADLEGRFGLHITILADDHVSGAHFAFERGELLVNRPAPVLPMQPVYDLDGDDTDEPIEMETEVEEAVDSDEVEASSDDANRRRRRRRRRRGDKVDEVEAGAEGDAGETTGETTGARSDDGAEASPETDENAEEDTGDDEPRRRRRRGRRGGRRGRGERGEAASDEDRGEETVIETIEPATGETIAAAAEPVAEDEPQAGPLAEPQIERLAAEPQAEPAPEPERPELERPEPERPEPERLEAPVIDDARSERPAMPRAQTEIVASEPKVSSSAVDEPKRTGWWSRRGGFL